MEKFELNPAKLYYNRWCFFHDRWDKWIHHNISKCSWSTKCSCKTLHIHQENLCTKVLDFEEVIRNVVQCLNYIQAWGLNHQQFKAFLDELDSEYPDVMYFSAVRWLSRAATLKRFWNLWQEIKFFMKSKHQNAAFVSNENWLNDLTFLTDITQHLSDLNLRLQGKNQLVNKLFEYICAFEKKLELFQLQLSRAT